MFIFIFAFQEVSVLEQRVSLLSLSGHVSENPETPVATTIDFLTNLENSGEALRQNAVAPASNVQPMDFLQKLGVCPSNPTEMATNKADSRCVAFCFCFF